VFAAEPAMGLKMTCGLTLATNQQPTVDLCLNSATFRFSFARFSAHSKIHGMLEEPENKIVAGSKGYRISNGPVIGLARSDPKLPGDLSDVIELPRVYGEPLLFVVPRDPRTLFAYWVIDWSAIFENSAPVDRQVHVHVQRADGTEEATAAVEPMAGNCYLSVSQPRENYRVEIGYYQPKNIWNSVARSELVTMPPESISESSEVDLATIPFHLSFQRLIDLFRASNTDALSEIVSRLQKRAVSEEDRARLTSEEWEVLRAMNLSLDEIGAAQRAFLKQGNGAAFRRRAEALLGFGSTSTSRPFHESSWS